jgi:DNA-binding LacI/PurR family transcriptional regulator
MGDQPALQTVDERDPTPKYVQAQRILVDAIRSGHLAPGAKLPSTQDIGSLVKVSLITAHKALENLVEAGWLRREVGRGTYVREDVDISAPDGRELSVAILLDHHVNINDYYHSTILEALRQQARADTQRVEFYFQENMAVQSSRRNGHIGAICIHPPLEQQAAVERLADRHPVVVLGGAFPTSKVIFVDCDNHCGARDAVRHLIDLGHRRFLILGGPMNLSNSRDRADGARAELSAHGIALDERDLVVSKDSIMLDNETRTRLRDRIREQDRPTAIVAGGFFLALAAMQTVRAAGLEVPDDLSIVGFDDPASASLLAPPLTTVRQPLDEMAARAFQLIRQAVVDGSAGISSCKMPTELVVRGSTGPVRA